MTDEFKKIVLRLAERFPEKESAILPALCLLQKMNGHVSEDGMKTVAAIFNVPEARVFSAASYYSMLDLRPEGKYIIHVCSNVVCSLLNEQPLFEYISGSLGIGEGETTPDGLFSIREVECLGACGYAPAMQINSDRYENMTFEMFDEIISSIRKREGRPILSAGRQDRPGQGPDMKKILTANAGIPGLASIKTSIEHGGYEALKKAVSMKPEEVISMVEKSDLRGMGGGGFPAGLKWKFLKKDTGGPVYLICNADEGEPGTFKDRYIMEFDPHLLIEGMIITAYATGAGQGFIYIRGEYQWIAEMLSRAVDEAVSGGLLGDNILGSGFSFHIDIFRGAGSYVCGEETALLESLEGRAGRPRLRPPFPGTRGLYGSPTLIHNVTTLSCIPFIVRNGPDAFRSASMTGKGGTRLFGISGHVNRPGLYEYPIGVSLRDLIYDAAGGIRGGKGLKAVIPGGISTPLLKAGEIDIIMDYETLAGAKTMLGSCGIIVMDETVSIPRVARKVARFFAHESCGQCAPCREGTAMIKLLIDRIAGGQGQKKDIAQVLRLCRYINGSTICAFGYAVSLSIAGMIKKFRNEFEELLEDR